MIHILKDDFVEGLKDSTGKVVHVGGEDFYSAVVGLINLFKMQESFQVKAMGAEKWWEVKELNNKPVDYVLAMLGEIGEGIHSLDFKWWGPGSEDRENFITELIDALHFELSNTVRVFWSQVRKGDLSIEEAEVILRKELARFGGWVSNSYGWEEIIEPKSGYTQASRNNLMKIYILKSLENDKKLWFIEGIVTAQIIKLEELFLPIDLLFRLASSYGVSGAEVFSRYTLKNALNQVRKMNGYKEGTYIKNWISIEKGTSEEDNAIALQLVKNKELIMEEMVVLLDSYYKDVVKVAAEK